jgi:hypothetical protein
MRTVSTFGQRVLRGLVLAAFVAASVPAHAMDVAPDELDAIARTLGFVESLQRRTPLAVDVVYRTGDNDAKARAQRAAAALTALSGPRTANIAAVAVSAGELALGGHRVDVIYIMPSAIEAGRTVAEFVHRQRILSISSDPNCLTSQCCTLMVRAGARTEIILDTALAQETGVIFSSVFMMMVKRK